MNLDNVYVCDLECDGLLDVLTKLHVLSVGWRDKQGKWNIKSTTKEEDVKKLFENPSNIIVGHYFLGFDVRALKKLFPNIQFNAFIIDTLPLSWYLYNQRSSHGLDSWGSDVGIEKPPIEDWEGLSFEEYKHRCEEDVKININIWHKFLKLLRKLYSTDQEIISIIKNCNFKIELQVLQEENKIKLDVEKCKENLTYLEGIIEEKTEELKSIMPKIENKVRRKRPKSLYKKNGDLSVAGEKWRKLTEGCGLDLEYNGEIDEVVSYDEPNPQSNVQIKDFLFSKGWKPKLFKDGANGPVPQLRDDDKNLCKSIISMIDEFPELKALDGLSVAQHRAGYLKGFLETMDENGYIKASWHGMAKTWRVKHIKPIVNLPANDSDYGELVRSVLIAPKGKIFVNADLASLEDKTKQIGIYDLDKKYVDQLNIKGYDAHLTIALRAGFMTEDEVSFYNWYKKEDKSRDDEGFPKSFSGLSDEDLKEAFGKLTKVRKTAKTTNYAATYNASAKKIGETADIPLKEAKIFHKAYWDLNWAIKKLADSFETKKVDGREWIYSPFTKTWLLLTAQHIKFSAVNQNFGAKIFDLWAYFLIQSGVKPIMSMHDEMSWYIDEGDEEKTKEVVQNAINRVNKIFNHPIKFEASPEFAKSYGDVH